jgi:hypothetical protein
MMTLPPSPDGAQAIAPATAQIGDLVVGVWTAQIGTSSQSPGKEYLTLTLRITNRAANPMTYIRGWSDPKVSVTLLDQNRNYYNRLPSPNQSETQINPGLTIEDTIDFEAPPRNASLELHLPIGAGDKTYVFLIPAPFIQRPRAIASAARPKVQGKVQPGPAMPNDLENDPRVRDDVYRAYSVRMMEINAHVLRLSTNHGTAFRKQETTKLFKKLADDSKLNVVQIMRIIDEEQRKRMSKKR